MRSNATLGLIFGLLSFLTCPVRGQLEQLPRCAVRIIPLPLFNVHTNSLQQTCFMSAVGNQTECPTDSVSCICASSSINAAIQGCVGMACTVREALVAVNTTSTMCGTPVRDKSDVLLYVAIISGILALVSIIMRTTVAVKARHLRLDDACALAAWTFSIPLTVLQFVTPGLGLGKDTWTVDPQNIVQVLKVPLPLVMDGIY